MWLRRAQIFEQANCTFISVRSHKGSAVGQDLVSLEAKIHCPIEALL